MIIKAFMAGGSNYYRKPLKDIALDLDSIVAKDLIIHGCETPEEIELFLKLEEIIKQTGPIFFIVDENDDRCKSFFFLDSSDEKEFDASIQNAAKCNMMYYYQLRNAFANVTYNISKELDKSMFLARGKKIDDDYSFVVTSSNIPLKEYTNILGRKNKRAFTVKDSPRLTNIIMDAIKKYEYNKKGIT